MEHALGTVSDLLPKTEFRDWALSVFSPRHPDEHLGDGLARLLFAMFGKYGLLVIEPRDLPPAAFDVLPRWRAMADQIQVRTRAVSEHLSDVGFDVTLDPGTTLMFQCSGGGRRVALSDEDSVAQPRDLSPGVLLRPLWQDTCLPTVGFVVGPGELSYLAVVCSLYKLLGVPQPALVARSSITLVERSLAMLLDRFSWDIPDLIHGPDVLARSLDQDGGSNAETGLSELTQRVGESLTTLAARIESTDRPMVSSVERVRSKLVGELERLRERIRNSRQNRQGAGLRQIRRLCSNLRPRGRVQERVLGPLAFMVSHGPELADRLVDAADPFSVSHGVLEL
jgi:uncharacterized protein YllA (UPF0747 family)